MAVGGKLGGVEGAGVGSGALLGVAVGAAVGFGVGAAVGLGVGVAVGLGVGVAVGFALALAHRMDDGSLRVMLAEAAAAGLLYVGLFIIAVGSRDRANYTARISELAT